MDEQTFLNHLCEVLNEYGVPYSIAGYTSVFYVYGCMSGPTPKSLEIDTTPDILNVLSNFRRAGQTDKTTGTAHIMLFDDNMQYDMAFNYDNNHRLNWSTGGDSGINTYLIETINEFNINDFLTAGSSKGESDLWSLVASIPYYYENMQNLSAGVLDFYIKSQLKVTHLLENNYFPTIKQTICDFYKEVKI